MQNPIHTVDKHKIWKNLKEKTFLKEGTNSSWHLAFHNKARPDKSASFSEPKKDANEVLLSYSITWILITYTYLPIQV